MNGGPPKFVYAAPAPDDELKWLAQAIPVSLQPPRDYESTLLLMNPVLGPSRNSYWSQFRRSRGEADYDVIRGYPARPSISFGNELESSWSVDDGELDLDHRRALKKALGNVSATAVVGLYRGFGGDARPYTEANIRRIDGKAYGFVVCELTELLDAWGGADGSIDMFGFDWVSFIWPTDRSWFFHMDPDAPFAYFACDRHMRQSFVESSHGELWAAELPLDKGVHRVLP